MSSVAFHTIGCKVNHYETEAVWEIFNKNGYVRVDFEELADVYVINTCTVTNAADKKSKQIIRRAIRKNPEAIIAVMGCYSQIFMADDETIPGVHIIIGTEGKDRLFEYVREFSEKKVAINNVINIMKVKEFEELNVEQFSDRTRATIKIQEGCNNFCTYCIIPWARGLSRSRNPQNIYNQAKQLVANGYNEIVLTGIHTGGYGEDLENYSLAKLLSDLDSIEGLQRIRISSIEVTQINDEILDVLGRSKKMVRHLHIPLQAGEDQILGEMKRNYTTKIYRDKIIELRKVLPQLAITTDIITGFPGETIESFNSGYKFIEDIKFAELHVFPYSIRTGTPAAIMKNQVNEIEKQNRVQELIELSKRLSINYREKFLGDFLEVIPENMNKKNCPSNFLLGHSDNYIPIKFEGTEDLIKKICVVRIDAIGADFCRGTFIKVKE
ncbi:MAG: tRNA (N(6)-L-threonylcarbamoyladenosine(37)-C(2))-methylthiotransferase MtaB [Vulcanibacillus sp.]